MTLQPASQNFFVEIKDDWDMHGTIWASVINDGSHGIFKLHMCVDLMILLFDRVMVRMGLLVAWIFAAGVSFIRKCTVAPESDSASWTTGGGGYWELGRGPGWLVVDIEQNSSPSIESSSVSQSVVIVPLVDSFLQVVLEIRTVIPLSSSSSVTRDA